MQYPGKGDGRDSDLSLTGNVSDTSILSTFVGTSGSTSCTLQTGLSINAGDCLYIVQIQGTGAPSCEYEFVSSYNSGTGATVLYNPLDNSYSCTAGDRAQCIVAKQYRSVAGNGYSISGQVWSGTTGGIYSALCQNAFDVTVNLDACGFAGGAGGGKNGDGTGGNGQVQTQSNNGNGGGGAGGVGDGGAGGENSGGATTGITGSPGVVGAVVGNASLTTPAMGGGGGSGSQNGPNGGAAGGKGGGIIDVIADTLGANCILRATGANGIAASGSEGRGGGGAAGSIRARATTILSNLANWLISGGSTSTGSGHQGGVGGNGRVRVEICTDSSSGDTTPASSKVTGGNTWCSVLGGVI